MLNLSLGSAAVIISALGFVFGAVVKYIPTRKQGMGEDFKELMKKLVVSNEKLVDNAVKLTTEVKISSATAERTHKKLDDLRPKIENTDNVTSAILEKVDDIDKNVEVIKSK